MAGYTDTFERADGPLGADWSSFGGSWGISGGRAYSPSIGVACPVDVYGSGPQTVTLLQHTGATDGVAAQPYVKVSSDGSQGYYLTLLNRGSQFDLYIGWLNGGSFSNMANVTVNSPSGTDFSLSLTWASGLLTGAVNGVDYLTVSDTRYESNSRVGMRAIGYPYYVSTFTTTAEGSKALAVSPDPLWIGGGSTQLTLTGTGTLWTAGVPGSTTISVDHGTIDSQYVIDHTHAVAFVTPADYVGPIVVTESEYGLQDTIYGTATPQEGQGTAQCPFNPEFVDLANQTGIDANHRKLTTTSDLVLLEPTMGYQDALAYLITLVRNLYPGGAPLPPYGVTPDPRLNLIWDAINGGVEQPQGIYSPTSDQPVKLDTEQSLASLKYITSNGSHNLGTVISDIAGSGGYNLTTLLEAIPSGDSSAVLAELAAIRGDTTTSLYTLLSSLAGIRTIDALSLRDVLQAIDLLPKTMDGGYSNADRLANAGGFTGVLLAIGALAATEAEDAAVSTTTGAGVIALAAELASGIASLLEALQGIRSLLGGDANEYRAPVWPGAAHVTYGESYDLATTTHVPGPMHGVELNITATEPKTLFYDYDGHTAWRHIGGLVFYNDAGKHETYQALGFATALYVPKTLAVAQGCRLFKNRLPKGTIRPWSIIT